MLIRATYDSDESNGEKVISPLARLIYEQMNIEPRQMHVTIKMQKAIWTRSAVILSKRAVP